MPKKPGITDQEAALFRNAMRNIKPIVTTKVIPPQKTPPKKKPRDKIENNEPEDIFSDYENLPPVSRDTLLHYSQPGVQHKTLRNLRNGKYNMEATLDLHGQTIIEARKSLHQFLMHCEQTGKRYVLIIHGKGRQDSKPILKNKLNHWLRQTDQVLAFCSATVQEGSSGSLFVLLKRRN